MEERVQEEMPADQHTGGHHPAREGEVFNTRYQALCKLGCGAFATVWLCQDMRRKKQVAVKVLKSREGFIEAAQDEVALLRCVSSMKKKDRAGENIVCLLDDFRMIGENGFHILLLECCSSGSAKPRLPSESHRRVLAGLHFLHQCCRIIHADIKPENVLLYGRDKSLQRLLPDTLDCDQRIDLRLKGPGGDLGNRLEESDLMSIQVKIADLGSACWTYKPFSKEIQTQPYRALEVLLGLDYGTPADIWSMGCLAFEMVTGECLFDPQPGKYFSRDDDHVARIIELLGRIPPQIAFSWNKSTKFFSRPGALLRISRLSPCSLHTILKDRHKWTKPEVPAFTSFLLPALQYAPERRATAAQCLQHAWLSAP
ncbi:PREDICTED: SRSF protein kinase 3-like [Tauraco erythrolophus]|uniref:SRSF protein kinase 3-like n=1 Tax=Tauraco erythrolophus TaxID=121530 RepID=UPI00052319C0|nr:PREDICTED: SRSF protein kinase 3-like [Tauraco erythrolophus]